MVVNKTFTDVNKHFDNCYQDFLNEENLAERRKIIKKNRIEKIQNYENNHLMQIEDVIKKDEE